MLDVRNLSREYRTPAGALSILSGISLKLDRGEAAAIMGPSGSGKSTLLYAIGGLDAPTSGTVTLDGKDPYSLSEAEQAAFRNRHVGFVFQDHLLLPQCSALENVLVPSLVAKPHVTHEGRATTLLHQVGLGQRLHHRPSELSGGEKQRVAIARALICEPALVLCDEPTGNLDRAAAETVADVLLETHRSLRTILIVVTHSAELASRFSVRFELNGGKLQPA